MSNKLNTASVEFYTNLLSDFIANHCMQFLQLIYTAKKSKLQKSNFFALLSLPYSFLFYISTHYLNGAGITGVCGKKVTDLP